MVPNGPQTKRVCPVSPAEHNITLAVLGASEVGKTAIVSQVRDLICPRCCLLGDPIRFLDVELNDLEYIQFLWNVFTERHVPTVDETNWVEYELFLSKMDGNGGEKSESKIFKKACSPSVFTLQSEESLRRKSNALATPSKQHRHFKFPNHRASIKPDAIIMLKVIDTGGSSDFPAMRRLYEQTADGVMVVFDVSDPETWQVAKTTACNVLEHNTRKAPVLLVGNKIDLEHENLETVEKVESDVERFVACRDVECMRLTARDGDQICFTKHMRDSAALRDLSDSLTPAPRLNRRCGSNARANAKLHLQKHKNGKKECDRHLGVDVNGKTILAGAANGNGSHARNTPAALRKRRQSVPSIKIQGSRRGSTFDPQDLVKIQHATSRQNVTIGENKGKHHACVIS